MRKVVLCFLFCCAVDSVVCCSSPAPFSPNEMDVHSFHCQLTIQRPVNTPAEGSGRRPASDVQDIANVLKERLWELSKVTCTDIKCLPSRNLIWASLHFDVNRLKAPELLNRWQGLPTFLAGEVKQALSDMGKEAAAIFVSPTQPAIQPEIAQILYQLQQANLELKQEIAASGARGNRAERAARETAEVAEELQRSWVELSQQMSDLQCQIDSLKSSRQHTENQFGYTSDPQALEQIHNSLDRIEKNVTVLIRRDRSMGEQQSRQEIPRRRGRARPGWVDQGEDDRQPRTSPYSPRPHGEEYSDRRQSRSSDSYDNEE